MGLTEYLTRGLNKPKKKARKRVRKSTPNKSEQTKAIVKTQSKQIDNMNNNEISKQKIIDYMDAFGLSKELLPEEKKQFLSIAMEFGLNPFKHEIHCVAYGKGEYRRLSIIVGYEVYLKRAEKTGLLNGWKVWTEGTGKDMKAIIEISRKDWQLPLRHEVYLKEVEQYKKSGELNAFWKKQPSFMLKKVAISQGFRLAFPVELGGIPYTADELPEEMTCGNEKKTEDKPALSKPVKENKLAIEPVKESKKKEEPKTEIHGSVTPEQKTLIAEIAALIKACGYDVGKKTLIKEKIKSALSVGATEELKHIKQDIELDIY